MSAENKLLHLGRATIAGTLLAGTVASPFLDQLLGFGAQTSSASELGKSENQALEFTPQMAATISDLQSGDIDRVSSHLATSLSWGLYTDSAQASVSRQEMLNLLSASFKSGKPQCVGFFNAGRAQVGYVIQGLKAKNPNNPASLVIGGGEFTKAEIAAVKELSQADFDRLVRGGLTSCKVGTARTVSAPTPVPSPTPRSIESLGPENMPDGLKGRKIAFVRIDNGQENVVVAKLDGSDQEKITNDARSKRDLKALPSGGIVYSSLGTSADNGTKNQVVYNNLNKNEKVVWSGSSEEGIPFCPTGTDKYIYWSSRETTDAVSENIYRVNIDGSGTQRVTTDNIGNSEHCMVVSHTGQAAIGIRSYGQPGRPFGIAVYQNTETVSQDFDANNLPKLIRGDIPIDWTPDGEWLIFTRQENGGSNLYKAHADGSGEAKLMEGVYSVGLSPDGQWLMASAGMTGSSDIRPYLVSINGGKPMRLADTLGKIGYMAWLNEKPKITRNVVLVLQGMNSQVIGSRLPDNLTSNLFTALPEFGYDNTRDFGLLSVTGGKIVDGWWLPNKQSCDDTRRDPETLGLSVATDIKKILDSDSELSVTVLGHSYGGLIIANAMEAIDTGIIGADSSRIKLITVDSPIQGVDNLFFDRLGTFFVDQMEAGCQLGGLIPNPDYLNTPAGQTLISMWDHRKETQDRWYKTSTSFQSKGGQIFTLGNIQDCVMSPQVCVNGYDLEVRILNALFWRRTSVITQEMPGAKNTWRSLGILGWGHDRYFKDIIFQGLPTLLSVIGHQISNEDSPQQGLARPDSGNGAQSDFLAGINAVNSALQLVESNGVNLKDVSFKTPDGLFAKYI